MKELDLIVLRFFRVLLVKLYMIGVAPIYVRLATSLVLLGAGSMMVVDMYQKTGGESMVINIGVVMASVSILISVVVLIPAAIVEYSGQDAEQYRRKDIGTQRRIKNMRAYRASYLFANSFSAVFFILIFPVYYSLTCLLWLSLLYFDTCDE